MICSSSSTGRRVGLGLALALALTAGSAGAAELAPTSAPAVAAPQAAEAAAAKPLTVVELDAFLARFAAMRGLSAKFREEKTMALLAAPLVNEGVLYFAAPGRLARHTTSPFKASVIIDGERLTFGDGRGVEAIRFDQNPMLGLFVASFVKIFAGDKEALAKMYAMELSGDPAASWTLRLRPTLAPMDKVIKRIEIAGEGLVIHRMKVIEASGDETVTTFTEVNTDRGFSEAELAELFRVSAATR